MKTLLSPLVFACSLISIIPAHANVLSQQDIKHLFKKTCVPHNREVITNKLVPEVAQDRVASLDTLQGLQTQIVTYEEGESEIEVLSREINTKTLAYQLEMALEYSEHQDLDKLNTGLSEACNNLEKAYIKLSELTEARSTPHKVSR